MAKPLPSQKYLKECFFYNRFSGKLFWKKRPLHHFKNKQAWVSWNTKWVNKEIRSVSTRPKGSTRYLSCGLKGRRLLAHRVIYKLQYGSEPDIVDHINGDGLDNRLRNLRSVNSAGNAHNARLFKNNTSGHVGVVWYKNDNKWTANIIVNNVRIHLGSFIDKNDAIKARKEAEKVYWV